MTAREPGMARVHADGLLDRLSAARRASTGTGDPADPSRKVESTSRLVTGIVVAGGRSRRIGTDKRFLRIDGSALIDRAVDAVAAASDVVVIACRRDDPARIELARPDATVVFDLRADAGPLAGLEAGLRAAVGDLAVVVAADMPWISVAVLRHLVDLARTTPSDAVVTRSWSSAQPLLAVYRRTTLRDVEQLLDEGEHRVQRLLDRLSIRWVAPPEWLAFDPTGRCLTNLNEPRDLDLVS